ncbi:1-acyl-sn-glycerol-3-phosphate acyltransferase [Chryseobacterium gotjawalense]|uniref:1-acyl-sn-glycerol-3-phosphate acyltransferase n=1 Tax=Chryseobacterium gotjawalense TaxID=3042315 RepID=A0ABY8RG33_9FLAO|nr:1-acyl-sn-glycerol-3-phosphate acyltransferase [Chryseobacterium sp. wdc7]WHF52935.1 1-acyl-sn-glycerol-3-phosphate acyltransferase [Chryseobacterium sp. wdc7]
MKKLFGKLMLKILGWKVVLEGDVNNLDRCILVVAPHTANDEYMLGNFAYWSLGKPLKVIIKDQHTKAWYGFLVKAMGGVGIDRSQKNDLVKFVADLFKKEDFSLVITPEGTRSWVPKWRKGFYHMALAAKVPLVIASGDFKEKIIYLGKKISVEDLETRTYENIMAELQEYYKKRTPKVPENWNPKIY